ncbi:hypothetical protein EVAR_43769_1 [Eumeta japonica]|uniref:Uncharacterized protein n=1 Tax=Eumeta variegata TaxID=151549 RepID=A0A4C1XGF3_EUMVA|nr:hypothetical protein EVAR_43769_1 [Eumeta japonica]
MKTVNLQLAKHKTDAVLITRTRKAETIKLQVGEQEITSQPYIRYLGVMIDVRINFKQQVEHVSTKAIAVRAGLARLMPNVGGPKQSKRLLLSSVVTSVLTYGISLRVLAKEKQTLYQRKRSSTLSNEELKEEEWQNSICRWQLQWDAGKKGRWTHRLIPQIDVWLNRNHGEVNYYLTQMLSGHDCFRAYLHRFKRDDSPEYPSYPGKPEDAEHVFFVRPRFNLQRDQLEIILNQRIQPETLVQAMLSTRAAWNATSTFATEVLTDLRSIERKRARDSN